MADIIEDDHMAKQRMAYMRENGCKCNCCMWHRSPTIKIILAIMFLGLVADLAAQVALGPTVYLSAALLGFIGVILLIVFMGWVLSMACSCKGRHWIHGADEDPFEIARVRYAKGDITKKQYLEIKRDISN